MPGGGLEPGVLDRSMAGHQVQQDMETAPVGFLEELAGVVICPVTCRDLIIVAHIVAGILEGAVEAWVEPQRIDAQILEVFQFLKDTRQVANAIAV